MKRSLLLKADLCRLLSRLFSEPDPERVEESLALIQELGQCELPHPLREVLEGLKEEIAATPIKDWEKEYIRLFLQGRASLSETHYTTTYPLPDTLAFYAAFRVKPKAGELPDALPYTLEFLGYLYLKEAIAERKEEGEVVREARIRFVKEHLQWLPLLQNRLRGSDPQPPYPRLLKALLSLWEMELREPEGWQEKGEREEYKG